MCRRFLGVTDFYGWFGDFWSVPAAALLLLRPFQHLHDVYGILRIN